MLNSFRDINFYNEPFPDSPKTIPELETLANERLKLYSWLSQNENCLETLETLRLHLCETHLQPLLSDRGATHDWKNILLNDLISHWLMRLAYCDCNRNIQSFIKFELKWLKILLSLLDYEEKWNLLERKKLEEVPIPKRISQIEKTSLMLDIYTTSDFDPRLIYHKVKISESNNYSITLLKKGNYMKNGFLYFNETEIDDWILEQLSRRWPSELRHCKKMLAMKNDDRLKFILSGLNLVFPSCFKNTMISYGVTDENVDGVVAQFPLCMRFLHEVLRKTHHLKYFGRMQYGRFLKGLGLTCEQSQNFWRKEFHQTAKGRTKWKKYSYFFKHIYGEVGRRIEYEPFDCEAILSHSVPIGGSNGCPFQHCDSNFLAQKLNDYGIEPIQNILQMKDEAKFTTACTRCLQSTLNCSQTKLPNEISHPNEYFLAAMKIVERRGEGDISDIEDLFI